MEKNPIFKFADIVILFRRFNPRVWDCLNVLFQIFMKLNQISKWFFLVLHTWSNEVGVRSSVFLLWLYYTDDPPCMVGNGSLIRSEPCQMLDFVAGCQSCPPPGWSVKNMCFLVLRTQMPIFCPSLRNISSNCLLQTVLNTLVQEVIFMEDYLVDMHPIYSSRYLRFYPWLKPDDQRASYLDQMILVLCGSRHTDLCLSIVLQVCTEELLERKAMSMAIILNERMVS